MEFLQLQNIETVKSIKSKDMYLFFQFNLQFSTQFRYLSTKYWNELEIKLAIFFLSMYCSCFLKRPFFHIFRVTRIVTSGCHVPWISWISTDLRKTEKKCICVTSTSCMTCIFLPAVIRKPPSRSNFMLMTCHGQTDLYIPTSGTYIHWT